MIVAISGKSGSGKDTFGNVLVAEFGFVKINFADTLKSAATLLGWDGVKDGRGRKLLQQLSSVVNAYDETIWTKLLLNRIGADRVRQTQRIVICDMRYMHEFATLVDLNAYTVRINRRPGEWGLRGEAALHPSEIELDDVQFEQTVENEASVEVLRRDARQVAKNVLAVREGKP